MTVGIGGGDAVGVCAFADRHKPCGNAYVVFWLNMQFFTSHYA